MRYLSRRRGRWSEPLPQEPLPSLEGLGSAVTNGGAASLAVALAQLATRRAPEPSDERRPQGESRGGGEEGRE